MHFTVDLSSYHLHTPTDFVHDRIHGPSEYAFVHFMRPMMLYQNGKMVPINEDAFMIFSHGKRQYYYPQTVDMLENWCHFGCQNLPEFLNELEIPLDQPFYIQDPIPADGIFKKIVSGYHDNNTAAVNFGMFSLFYYLATALQGANYLDEKTQKLYQLRLDLQNRLHQNLTVSDMAQMVNFSPAYFNELYKKTFGISPKQDMSRMRIEQAKHLLCSTSYSVEHISQQLGYDSFTSFITKFKKAAGTTPLQYRKKWTQN